MAIVHTNHKKAGAPNRRLTLPQPLDPVEAQLALLVVHKLVVEALSSFSKNGPLYLVAEALTEYPVFGHEDVPSWSGPPGVLPPRGPLVYQQLHSLMACIE